jgi:hypothetical protein
VTDSPHELTLSKLSNTRDLRAGMLSLAAKLVIQGDAEGRMIVVNPVISPATVRKEWEDSLPAIASGVRERMTLTIEERDASAGHATKQRENDVVTLDKPNYLFEVLRLLLGASLEHATPAPEAGIAAHIEGTQVGLVNALGVSPTPVRAALEALRNANLIRSLRWLEIEPEALSMDQLSRLGALPQALRFRYERGARLKPPRELLNRAEQLLGPKGRNDWQSLSLSGVPVAQLEAPTLDLVGVPRLDLVAHVPRGETTFDADVMRLLDDGLELEPNVLAHAPVVVTLVRAGTRFDHGGNTGQVRCAHPCDVFLSLLDMGLREQALQYAKAARK